ncbi:MAG: 8-oxo-dGTP diphosphatase MutT [Prochloron sp. SP5CPC1]|nr:8-oxo-dGTP diphosphatase MutT [Candidatus Paraprochloron terpiosi SP5CPC1]
MTTNYPPLPHKKNGVGVIVNDRGEILIDRRRNSGLMGGLWEFPGGKIEVGETVPACIKREIKEELALDVEVGNHLITINHTYSQFIVTLIVHYCFYLGGEPQPLECDKILWVTLAQIDNFTFPEANSKIIAALRQDRNYSAPTLPLGIKRV